jgi:hypothetical protein
MFNGPRELGFVYMGDPLNHIEHVVNIFVLVKDYKFCIKGFSFCLVSSLSLSLRLDLPEHLSIKLDPRCKIQKETMKFRPLVSCCTPATFGSSPTWRALLLDKFLFFFLFFPLKITMTYKRG